MNLDRFKIEDFELNIDAFKINGKPKIIERLVSDGKVLDLTILNEQGHFCTWQYKPTYPFN